MRIAVKDLKKSQGEKPKQGSLSSPSPLRFSRSPPLLFLSFFSSFVHVRKRRSGVVENFCRLRSQCQGYLRYVTRLLLLPFPPRLLFSHLVIICRRGLGGGIAEFVLFALQSAFKAQSIKKANLSGHHLGFPRLFLILFLFSLLSSFL